MSEHNDEQFLKWIQQYLEAEEIDRAHNRLNLICINITKRLTLFILTKVRPSDSEDVLQETLKAIVANLAKFRGQTNGQFLTWCYRIARNKIADHHRKRRRTTELDQFPMQEIERLLDAANFLEPPSPEIILDLKDAMTSLAKKKPKCRELLWDHFMVGLDYAELGSQLDLKNDTVRMRIERCLDAAKKLLAP